MVLPTVGSTNHAVGLGETRRGGGGEDIRHWWKVKEEKKREAGWEKEVLLTPCYGGIVREKKKIGKRGGEELRGEDERRDGWRAEVGHSEPKGP